LLGCGLVGAALFVAVYLIEGAARPGYDAWTQAVSALSLGPGGWVQRTNFVVFGLLLGAYAVGLRAALAPGVGATWAPLLKGVEGLGLAVAGLFAQDPSPSYPPGVGALATPTAHATVHNLATYVTFIAGVASWFVLARRFAAEPRWRAWAIYAAATGILMMVFLATYGQEIGRGPAGVFERLATMVTALLTIALVARLLAGPGRISSAG
jgi:hypothetical membrane protein